MSLWKRCSKHIGLSGRIQRAFWSKKAILWVSYVQDCCVLFLKRSVCMCCAPLRSAKHIRMQSHQDPLQNFRLDRVEINSLQEVSFPFGSLWPAAIPLFCIPLRKCCVLVAKDIDLCKYRQKNTLSPKDLQDKAVWRRRRVMKGVEALWIWYSVVGDDLLGRGRKPRKQPVEIVPVRQDVQEPYICVQWLSRFQAARKPCSSMPVPPRWAKDHMLLQIPHSVSGPSVYGDPFAAHDPLRMKKTHSILSSRRRTRHSWGEDRGCDRWSVGRIVGFACQNFAGGLIRDQWLS